MEPFWETIWQFMLKLKIVIPYDPAILPVGLFPRKTLKSVFKAMCRKIHIAALIVIGKN